MSATTPILAAAGLLILTEAAAAGDLHRVVMRDVGFSPATITTHVGDTVEWMNEDIFAHTATAEKSAWEVDLPPGGSGRVTMGSPGTASYVCRYHPNMIGEILVLP
jgi:plastocyanin